MKLKNTMRLTIGLFVLISAILAKFVNINFIYITIFVGLNMIQSSFTNWCLLEIILKKFIKD